jgi:hypothetical protein
MSAEGHHGGDDAAGAARTGWQPAREAARQYRPRPLADDPDDAKTAPQPAIRIPPVHEVRPVPEFRPTEPPPGSGPAGSGPAGSGPGELVPGMSPARAPQRRAPRPRESQPSWFAILATTIRLWWERRASSAAAARARTAERAGSGVATRTSTATPAGTAERASAAARTGAAAPAGTAERTRAVPWRRIRGTILVLVVLAAAGIGIVLSPSGPSGQKPAGGGNPVLTAQDARGEAAAWIAQQAGRNAIVSCDPVMCSALLAHGFPAANLDSLGPNAPDPLGSDLVVATAVLRSQFGSRLTSVYAPVRLAAFGVGSAEVDIRVVAPDGAPVYVSGLRADLSARQAVGAQLLRNSKIAVSSSARPQLASGMVDSRLLVTLATMADDVHPLQIASFGGASRGASPGVPLRTAVLLAAATGPGGRAAALNSLRGFLQAQQPPYLPASTQIVPVAGQSALRVQFAAPTPLGLLNTSPTAVKIPSRP